MSGKLQTHENFHCSPVNVSVKMKQALKNAILSKIQCFQQLCIVVHILSLNNISNDFFRMQYFSMQSF